MSSILSALCKERDLRTKSPILRTPKDRSTSSFHGSNLENLEGSSHQSVGYAHNSSDGPPSNANTVPGSAFPSKKFTKRAHAITNRYSHDAERPVLSNLIQQHCAKDRKAGQEFTNRTILAMRRRDKKIKRCNKYRERRLGTQHSSRQGHRVSKIRGRKQPQQAEVNVKHTNRKKQKKALDDLFAEAGYK